MVTVFLYASLMAWILLFFVHPNDIYPHIFVAGFIIFSLTLVNFTTRYIYLDYFTNDSLYNMELLNYITLVIITITSCLGFITYIFNIRNKRIIQAFAFFELLSVFLIVVFVSMFMYMPAIPDKKLICYLTS